jgi:hypothetical protein
MMTEYPESDIQVAANRANRTSQTIRRWIKQGVQITNQHALEEFSSANGSPVVWAQWQHRRSRAWSKRWIGNFERKATIFAR